MIDRLARAMEVEAPPVLVNHAATYFDARRKLINDEACIVITPALFDFPRREQMAVLAHELSHVKLGSSLLQRTLDTLHRLTHLRTRDQVILSVLIGGPLAFIKTQPFHVITGIFMGFSIAAALLLAYHKTAGKKLERECDLHAVESTGLHDPMINALQRVQRMFESHHEQLHPEAKLLPRVAMLLFDPHPPYKERIQYIREHRDT